MHPHSSLCSIDKERVFFFSFLLHFFFFLDGHSTPFQSLSLLLVYCSFRLAETSGRVSQGKPRPSPILHAFERTKERPSEKFLCSSSPTHFFFSLSAREKSDGDFSISPAAAIEQLAPRHVALARRLWPLPAPQLRVERDVVDRNGAKARELDREAREAHEAAVVAQR